MREQQNDQCPAPVGGGLKVTRTVKRETLHMFNRDSLVNTARERANPSGGAYPDCTEAADEECCLALHQVSYDQDSAEDVESGCAARCLLERRTGFEHACLPGHDECMDDGAANGVAWTQSRFVKVMCFCGGRFSINPADNVEALKKDGEECEEDDECEGASICFNGKCRPPGIECDACDRQVDCDVGNSRAFGVFKCAYGQCIYDAQNQAPDGHACLNNIDCQSGDCATFAGDIGTNLLMRYCRSQTNGICGLVNTATYDQLGHPTIGYDVAHTGFHCWGDKMGGMTLECADTLCTTCDPATQTCQTGFGFGTTCADGCSCSSGICHPAYAVCTHDSGTFRGADGDACTNADQCASNLCGTCRTPAGSTCYSHTAPMAACADNCECASGFCIAGVCTWPDASFAGAVGDVCAGPTQCEDNGCSTCGLAAGSPDRCFALFARAAACTANCQCEFGCEPVNGRCLYETGTFTAPSAAGNVVCTDHSQCDSGRCNGLAAATWGLCIPVTTRCGACTEDADCDDNLECFIPPGLVAGRCIQSSGGLAGADCQRDANCASGKCANWPGAGGDRYCANSGIGTPCGGSSVTTHCGGYTGSNGVACTDGPCNNNQCLDNALCRNCNSAPCPAGYACSMFIPFEPDTCFFATNAPGGNMCLANAQCASGECLDKAFIPGTAISSQFCRPSGGEPCGYDFPFGAGRHIHCFAGGGGAVIKEDCPTTHPFCVPNALPHNSGTNSFGTCSSDENSIVFRRLQEEGADPIPSFTHLRAILGAAEYDGGITHRALVNGTYVYEFIPASNNTVWQSNLATWNETGYSLPEIHYDWMPTKPPPPAPSPPKPPPPTPSPPPPPRQCESFMEGRTNTRVLDPPMWCYQMRTAQYDCDAYFSMGGQKKVRMCKYSTNPDALYCEATTASYNCEFLPPSPPPPHPPPPPPSPNANEERRRQLDRVVDPLMGAHLTASDDCREDLMEFKLRFFQRIAIGGTVCDYDILNPYTSITGGTFPVCDPTITTPAAYDNCCTVDRHADHRSMYFLSNDNTGQNFANGVPIGDNVYGGESTAMITADLNGDGFEEILMANGIFFNTAGTFNTVPDLTFPGITAWKKLYVADMDAHNSYPDVVGLDVNGRAYIMRSSVAATPMATTFEARFDTSVQTGKPAERGNFMVECVLQDPACVASTACPSVCYAPFFFNTITEFDVYLKPDAYPIWRVGDRLRATTVVAADLAGSTCDGNKFLNHDVEIVRVEHFDMDTIRRDVATEQADATWAATTAHHPSLRTHHRLRLKFVDNTVCTAWPAGGAGYWLPAITTMTFTGTPKIHAAQTRPAPGLTPTFYPPQRIGGVDDFGAVDIAAVDALSHAGFRDTQKDICLLFRGRPVKCYLLPELPTGSAGQQIYDASNAKEVIHPDPFDDMHDAIGFARITASGAGRTFTAPGWQFEGEFLILNWEDDVTTAANERVPPGVTAGSVIRIDTWDATIDVSFIIERNRGRFYVEEAGEFFVKVRTGLFNYRYVTGSHEPCDSATTGTVYDRITDASCVDPPWIQQANKVPLCDMHGSICKMGTDNTDCAPLGYGATVAYDATYATVQTLGPDDDSCAFAGNGFCEDSAVGEYTLVDEAYKARGIGAGSHVPDQNRQNSRWQEMNFVTDNIQKACPRSEQEVNILADKDACAAGGPCGDGTRFSHTFSLYPHTHTCTHAHTHAYLNSIACCVNRLDARSGQRQRAGARSVLPWRRRGCVQPPLHDFWPRRHQAVQRRHRLLLPRPRAHHLYHP